MDGQIYKPTEEQMKNRLKADLQARNAEKPIPMFDFELAYIMMLTGEPLNTAYAMFELNERVEELKHPVAA